MAELQGRVAIITGSSSGIGAATAVLFASKGCSVTITGRNSQCLVKVKNDCKAKGLNEDQILDLIGDISDENTVKLIVEKTVEKFGKINILVNNAGVHIPNDESTEVYDQIMNTNLRSAYILSRLCTPYLIQTKGSIVNVSAVGSKLPRSTSMPYAISKAGMDQMTRCMAHDLAKHGVRVNTVNPGVSKTNIGRNSKINPEAALEHFKKFTPLNRWSSPDEIAQAIEYLVSEKGSFITGTHLKIDGGLTLNYNWGN